MGGNWVIVFYWSQAEKGKGKGERKRGRGGKRTAVREEIWGARTQDVRTWHWLRESLEPQEVPRAQGAHLFIGGERAGWGGAGEEESSSRSGWKGTGVSAAQGAASQGDGAKAGAKPLRSRERVSSRRTSRRREGLREERPTCGSRRSWKWDQSCSFIREGGEEPAIRDFFFFNF